MGVTVFPQTVSTEALNKHILFASVSSGPNQVTGTELEPNSTGFLMKKKHLHSESIYFTLGKQSNKCDGLAPRSEYVQVIICGKKRTAIQGRNN